MDFVVVGWLSVIAHVDLRSQRIPNALVLPGVVCAAAAAIVDPPTAPAALAAAVPYLAAFLCRAGGGGDVKLALVCGAWLGGVMEACSAVVLAAVFTVLAVGVRQLSGSQARGRGIAHAPALVVATLIVRWFVGS